MDFLSEGYRTIVIVPLCTMYYLVRDQRQEIKELLSTIIALSFTENQKNKNKEGWVRGI